MNLMKNDGKLEGSSIPISKHIVAFDSDCGPCTKFSHLIDRLDRYDKIVCLPILVAEKNGLLDKVPQLLHYKSFHLIFTDGQVVSGSEAILPLISILPMGRLMFPLLNYFPGGKRFVRFVYNRLSRSHDKGYCSIGD